MNVIALSSKLDTKNQVLLLYCFKYILNGNWKGFVIFTSSKETGIKMMITTQYTSLSFRLILTVEVVSGVTAFRQADHGTTEVKFSVREACYDSSSNSILCLSRVQSAEMYKLFM